MSADPVPQIASLGLEPTHYSAREAAVLLGRSYSWLDQRLRKGQFVLPDGTTVQPLRTSGRYRRFTIAVLRDVATSSYRQHWFSMEELRLVFRELAMAAYRNSEYPSGALPYGQLPAMVNLDLVEREAPSTPWEPALPG